MGACNFSTQKSLTVGMTSLSYTEEEVKQFAFENDLDDMEVAEQWMQEQDFDDMEHRAQEAKNFAEDLNGWLGSVLGLSIDTAIDPIYCAVVEAGYYDGWQLYIEDVDGADGENTLDYLIDWYSLVMSREQAQELIRKVYLTAQFILIDYAKNNGLGITSGGWTGGHAQYDRVDAVWEYYKQGADAELLAQWERLSK